MVAHKELASDRFRKLPTFRAPTAIRGALMRLPPRLPQDHIADVITILYPRIYDVYRFSGF